MPVLPCAIFCKHLQSAFRLVAAGKLQVGYQQMRLPVCNVDILWLKMIKAGNSAKIKHALIVLTNCVVAKLIALQTVRLLILNNFKAYRIYTSQPFICTYPDIVIVAGNNRMDGVIWQTIIRIQLFKLRIGIIGSVFFIGIIQSKAGADPKPVSMIDS